MILKMLEKTLYLFLKALIIVIVSIPLAFIIMLAFSVLSIVFHVQQLAIGFIPSHVISMVLFASTCVGNDEC